MADFLESLLLGRLEVEQFQDILAAGDGAAGQAAGQNLGQRAHIRGNAVMRLRAAG